MTAGAADITVEYQYPHVTVRVSHPTHLLAVLDELCQRTNANCELGPELAQVPLEPMIVQGTWFEVVRKLFEGTQFDLAAIAPGPQQAGQLLVRRRMRAKAVERQAAVLAGANQANGGARAKSAFTGASFLPLPLTRPMVQTKDRKANSARLREAQLLSRRDKRMWVFQRVVRIHWVAGPQW